MSLMRGHHDEITPAAYHSRSLRELRAAAKRPDPPKPAFDIDKRIEDEKESLSYLVKSRNVLAKAYGEKDRRTHEADAAITSARQYIKHLESEKSKQ